MTHHFLECGVCLNLRGCLGELLDKLLKIILSVYRYCISNVYVLWKHSFVFKGWCEKIVKSGDAQGAMTNK